MDYKSDVEKADRTTEAIRFPHVLLIDNTNACNLRCSMCDHQNIAQYRKVQVMKMDLYKKIIDEIAIENPKARVWEIFFGDPFLCRDMPERIYYAKEKGLQDVVLNTNGLLMTQARAEAYIRAGLDAMYVGIDAATPETYARIRVKGNFTKVVSNVLQYRDLLEKKGDPHQRLFVQFVMSDINQKEVEIFKRFWSNEGVSVKIRPKLSWAGLVDATNLQPNEQTERKPCYWLMRTINICADGSVALCSVDVHCRVPCGNVKEDSIKDLWQNGLLKTYRGMHHDQCFEKLPEMCRCCSDWQSGYAEFHEPEVWKKSV